MTRLAPLAIAIALVATVAIGCVRTVALTDDAGQLPPDAIEPLPDAGPDAAPADGPTPDAPDIDAPPADAATD